MEALLPYKSLLQATSDNVLLTDVLLTNVIMCNDMLCDVMLKLQFQYNLLHFACKILTLPAVGDGHYIPLITFTLNHLEFCKELL